MENACAGNGLAGVVKSVTESLASGDDAALAAAGSGPVFNVLEHLCEIGETDLACTLFERALGQGLQLPPPHVLSDALRRLGDGDREIACWRLWAEKRPELPVGWIGLTQRLERIGRYQEARDAAEAALRKFPKSLPLAIRAGRAHLLSGNRMAALAAFKRAQEASPTPPIWLQRAVDALQEDVIELFDMTFHVPEAVVSPRVMLTLATGQYEGKERAALLNDLRETDRVLEFGTGIGLLACSATQRFPGLPFVTVEANPTLPPVIRRNFASNGCGARLIEGVASLNSGQTAFHLTKDFWASSTRAEVDPVSTVERPETDANALIQDFRPSIVMMDIEGGEADLLPGLDLSGVRRVIIELHPAFYGNETSSDIIRAVLSAGLVLDLENTSGDVYAFTRP